MAKPQHVKARRLGQVHILFLDVRARSEEVLAEPTRLAVATSADVDVIQDDERMQEIDGIGAILRWPLDLGTATETASLS